MASNGHFLRPGVKIKFELMRHLKVGVVLDPYDKPKQCLKMGVKIGVWLAGVSSWLPAPLMQNAPPGTT